MHKILFLIAVTVLLASGGCYFPPIRIPIYTYQCIVPECSGRITDLNGKPLKGVRVRITSYGVVESAYSDADGNFKLKPLYKWVGMQYSYVIGEDIDRSLIFANIAGEPSSFFGEMALFFETPQEHFLLFGMNSFSSKYDFFQNHNIVLSYTNYLFYLCIPSTGQQKNDLPDLIISSWDKYYNFYILWELDAKYKNMKKGPNPWDHLHYMLYDRISWESYQRECKIKTPYSIVSFDASFIAWIKKKAVSKDVFETARKKVTDPADKYYGIDIREFLMLYYPKPASN